KQRLELSLSDFPDAGHVPIGDINRSVLVGSDGQRVLHFGGVRRPDANQSQEQGNAGDSGHEQFLRNVRIDDFQVEAKRQPLQRLRSLGPILRSLSAILYRRSSGFVPLGTKSCTCRQNSTGCWLRVWYFRR